jgi:hypothetical protein
MHAAPGVYAVLVGSGMSSAAGIPTGWAVIQDLIREVARADHVADEEVGDIPEQWWEAQGRGEPKYDELLNELAPTPAARQALLRRYFDPPPPQGPIQPTAVHRVLAVLCAQRNVRVVLTTNFDRLIERALEDAGASPQVVATVDDIKGMTPLAHARTTVIKLHGDYESSEMRNTREELGEYPKPLRRLLDRVLDEYGLLVIGWSAEHDTALADAISACPSRRYPTYWAAHNGRLTEKARRLIAARQAAVIETQGADALLHDLAERVISLDRRAERRGGTRLLRGVYRHPPDRGAPQGWSTVPLLQLCAVAELAPASIEQCGLIGPQDREELVRALQGSSVNNGLHVLSAIKSAFVTDEDALFSSGPLMGFWNPTPNAHQSTDEASYRWGRDATSGVSALATVRMPGVAQGGTILCLLDIAVSATEPVRLGTVASLWRDGLVLVSQTIPGALADVVPFDAEVQEVEIHAFAPQDAAGGMRVRAGIYEPGSNSVDRRIDLSPFGLPSREMNNSLGAAAQVDGGLTELDATRLVIELTEYIALANGYLDPRDGIAALRAELGLGASTPDGP